MKLSGIIALAVLLAAPLMADDEAAHRKIATQLDTTKIASLLYENGDLEEVVKDIAKQARINVVFGKDVLEDLDAGKRSITIELTDIKAGNALNIVLDQAGLKRSFRHGVLYVVDEENAEEASIRKLYDVRDITANIRDFPAPRLRLRGDEGGAGPQIRLPKEPDDPEVEDVVEMIEDNIEADWGNTANVSEVKGQLIIRAPRAVHQEVADLLRQLRAAK